MIKYIVRSSLVIIIGIIGIIVVGCGGTATPTSAYPLPEMVENFSENGSPDAVNFQTDLSADDIVSFYRNAFIERGLVEREILFVNNDGVVSMVFDGDESGQAIVVQAVILPTGVTNINIRKEAS